MNWNGKKLSILFGIICINVGVRWVVSLWPYSGKGKEPLFGDYEAQRHWMEITVGLPIEEWYHNSTNNDLLYWGLDYPPLTAYHSFLLGSIAKEIVPSMIELHSSRGIETEESKLFMRSTVLISEMIIYLPSILLFIYLFYASKKEDESRIYKLLFVILLQPSLILIDHGHFQYNSVSLGLTVWAICFLLLDWDLLGSIFFCLALNFKQMSLYHSLPFFFFLLGKSLQKKTWKSTILQIFKLGVVVLLTFTTLWIPFYLKGGNQGIIQLVNRMFPVGRGLFEDKVANLWCTLSVVPFLKLKQIFDSSTLFILSLSMTILGVLPSSYNLLRFPSNDRFLFSLFNASMSFFLFSFQVHEKTILLPLLPATLLAGYKFEIFCWFTLVSMFSMFPLLYRDGQSFPYFFLFLFFLMVSWILRDRSTPKITRWAHFLSLLGMIAIHLLFAIISPPSRFPDLFVLMFTSFSFLHFSLLFIGGNIAQLKLPRKEKFQ
eukprot:TRINITY_DN3471_c0_g1_i1.p1 TRINITY_DN3471_c0_g1~~TRINITY_DN3471_c0_g1_i1.p1  ORF type:complete len:489 (-),score=104.06 TRINITY_DN3471_c0_g1_i1:208-1674(-)